MRYHVTKVDYGVKALRVQRQAAVQQMLSTGASHTDRRAPHVKRWNMSRGMSRVRGDDVRVARETGHMQLLSFAVDMERHRHYVATRRDERKPTDSTCVTVPGDTLHVSDGRVTAAERMDTPQWHASYSARLTEHTSG
jgi:hypothetical protein